MPGRDIVLIRDFLNTLDERSFTRHGSRHAGGDALASVKDLAGWLAAHELVAAGTPASAADLSEAVALRDTLRAALKLRADPAIPGKPGPFNTVLAAFPLRTSLSTAMTPELTPSGQGISAGLAAIVATAAVAAAAGTWDRLKICAAGDCRWVFCDVSRNGAGRWCSMRTCGNRDKTRAYRHRKTLYRPE